MDNICKIKCSTFVAPSPEDVYIIGAYRTPIGSMGGQFKSYGAHELGGGLVKNALLELNIPNSLVEKVHMGQALVPDNISNPAEVFNAEAGLPSSVMTSIVKLDCVSSLRAIVRGCEDIKCNLAQFVICGGQESSSQCHASFKLFENRDNPYKNMDVTNCDVKKALVVGGLVEYATEIDHLKQGEHFAHTHHVTRYLQDKQAMKSIERALKAFKDKLFDNEILCFKKISKDETICIDRINETYNTLSYCSNLLSNCPLYLTPTITSGNSALYADGAAALLICSGKSTLASTKPPLARIVGFVEVDVNYSHDHGDGQILAIQKLFSEIHWNRHIVDLFEIYEPYAAQTIAITKALRISPFKVNVSGGTYAFGHPIGATGARMVVTLIHNLCRLGLRRGIVSVYTPTGLTIALAIEAC